MNVQRILVPVDFSESSADVAAKAAALATKLQSRVILLYVAEAPAGLDWNAFIQPTGRDRMTVEQYLHSQALEGIQPYVTELTRAGVEHDHLVRDGHPAETILAVAKELQIDLIMMGTHGRRGLQRLLLGSVAEEVLRRAEVPVMTVRYSSASESPP